MTSDRPTAAEARAAAQASAAANKGARDAALDAHFGGELPGASLLAWARGVTLVFTVVTIVTVVVDTRGLRVATAILDLFLFAAGCVLFVLALVRGAQRSRESDMNMAGWWFLTGSAPKAARVTLLGAVTVQTVVGVVGAAVRLQTALAFGVLVPTLGLAMCGLWSALHGYFPARGRAR